MSHGYKWNASIILQGFTAFGLQKKTRESRYVDRSITGLTQLSLCVVDSLHFLHIRPEPFLTILGGFSLGIDVGDWTGWAVRQKVKAKGKYTKERGTCSSVNAVLFPK